jgi:hypothetical protein
MKSEIVNLGVESVLDQQFDVIEYIKNSEVKVVALSLHWHYQSFDVIEVARKIKNNLPNVLIILGGFNASFFASEIMENYPFINGLIKGDGEKPLLQFVQESKKAKPDFKKVSNLIWRQNGKLVQNPLSYVATKTDFDELDYMNFSLLKNHRTYIDVFGRSASFYMTNASTKMNTMRRKLPSVPLAIGRGCSVNCKWCGGAKYTHKLISGRKKDIFRSIGRVVSDIKQAQQYGFGIFHTAHYARPDEDFYFIELFRKLRQKGISVSWVFECSTLPTRALVDAFALTFAKSNNSLMCLSRLTPDEKTRRRNIGYFYTNQELLDILEYMDTKKVPMSLAFTMGMAWENNEVLKQLPDFYANILKRFKHIKESCVLTTELEPGSFWFMFPENYGIETNRKSFSDYYEFHGKEDTSYFNTMGYQIPEYFTNSQNKEINFENKLQQIRCKNFCVLSGDGKWHSRVIIGPLKCNLMHLYWNIKQVPQKISRKKAEVAKDF